MARRSGFQKPKSAKKTLLRILSYLMRRKWLLLLVAVFVFISAAAAVTGTYMLKPIINECIVPLIGTSPQAADFVPLLRMLSVMAVVYLLGALSSYCLLYTSPDRRAHRSHVRTQTWPCSIWPPL